MIQPVGPASFHVAVVNRVVDVAQSIGVSKALEYHNYMFSIYFFLVFIAKGSFTIVTLRGTRDGLYTLIGASD